MTPGEKTGTIMEFIGAMFMLCNALYYHHFVAFMTRFTSAKPPSSTAILVVRVMAAIIAICLGFMLLDQFARHSN